MIKEIVSISIGVVCGAVLLAYFLAFQWPLVTHTADYLMYLTP